MAVSYLESYVDINDLEVGPDFLRVGQMLVENPALKLRNHARNGYVLLSFQIFLQGKLPVEQFMQIGDQESDEPLSPPALWHEAEGFVETMRSIDPGEADSCIFLIDRHLQQSRTAARTNVFFI